MIQKLYLIVNFASIVVLLSGAVYCQTKSITDEAIRPGENLRFPDNKMKTNRKSLQKIETLEKELMLLKTEVNELNEKLDKTNRENPSHIFKNQEFQAHSENGKTISNLLDRLPNEYIPSKKFIRRLLSAILEENFRRLKNEIVTELHDKLMTDYNIQKHVRRKRRETEQSETGDHDFFTIAEDFQTDNTYDNDFQYTGPQSALDRQLNKLTRMIEAELNQYRTDLNSEESAVNNELPEASQSVVQSDSRFGLSIEKIFDMLRNEVRNALQQQSRNVKITLNKHLDSVETKMTQISTNMEGMKYIFDKKFDNLLPTAITNGNRRIEQMETDILSLESGMNSLRENLIADPNIQEHLQQIHQKLQEEVARTVHPVKSTMHELQSRIQTNMRQQGVIETSMQNFKADMREKVHFMEINITMLGDGLKDINTTVSAAQKKSHTCSVNRTQIIDAVRFVDEIRDEWPYIWTNITGLEDFSRSNFESTKHEINNIVADIDKLSQNQTEVKGNINEFRDSLGLLSARITKMKRVNLRLALEYNEWVEHKFQHTLGRSSCLGGKRYIKKTKYKVGRYVGVLLCSATRYKIYLSDDIGHKFLDIGDSWKGGEDHCEFVGGTQSKEITVANSSNSFRSVPGYRRANWGETPKRGIVAFYMPSPFWYECGVSIP